MGLSSKVRESEGMLKRGQEGSEAMVVAVVVAVVDLGRFDVGTVVDWARVDVGSVADTGRDFGCVFCSCVLWSGCVF